MLQIVLFFQSQFFECFISLLTSVFIEFIYLLIYLFNFFFGRRRHRISWCRSLYDFRDLRGRFNQVVRCPFFLVVISFFFKYFLPTQRSEMRFSPKVFSAFSVKSKKKKKTHNKLRRKLCLNKQCRIIGLRHANPFVTTATSTTGAPKFQIVDESFFNCELKFRENFVAISWDFQFLKMKRLEKKKPELKECW